MMFIVGFIVGMLLAYLSIAVIVLFTDSDSETTKPAQPNGGTDDGV